MASIVPPGQGRTRSERRAALPGLVASLLTAALLGWGAGAVAPPPAGNVADAAPVSAFPTTPSAPAIGGATLGPTWITNGPVDAIAESGDRIYLGGEFTYVGPRTGSCVPIDASSGSAMPSFPEINERVEAVVADGAGGYYVGGSFTLVGGVWRPYLVHIRPDGTVDPAFDARPNGSVCTLALSGSTLYVGGAFDAIDGQSRFHIGAVDAASGSPTAWSPDAVGGFGYVRDVVVAGSTVYASGSFTSIGGQPRNGLAAIDTGTGDATDWNPDPDDEVWSLAVSGSSVYVGGEFSSIGGQTRRHIAALGASGNATAWDPAANSTVEALAVSGSTVYAGGQFSSIGGATRHFIAALDASTGSAKPGTPRPITW